MAQCPDVALMEIRRGSGTQFDPDVVAAFERIYPKVSAQATAAAAGADRPSADMQFRIGCRYLGW